MEMQPFALICNHHHYRRHRHHQHKHSLRVVWTQEAQGLDLSLCVVTSVSKVNLHFVQSFNSLLLPSSFIIDHLS